MLSAILMPSPPERNPRRSRVRIPHPGADVSGRPGPATGPPTSSSSAIPPLPLTSHSPFPPLGSRGAVIGVVARADHALLPDRVDEPAGLSLRRVVGDPSDNVDRHAAVTHLVPNDLDARRRVGVSPHLPGHPPREVRHRDEDVVIAGQTAVR